MSKTSVVTARVDAETMGDLDRLAKYYDRSRAWFVAKAIKQYVREESQFFAFLQEGEDAIDRGDFLTQDEMEAWIDSLEKAKQAA